MRSRVQLSVYGGLSTNGAFCCESVKAADRWCAPSVILGEKHAASFGAPATFPHTKVRFSIWARLNRKGPRNTNNNFAVSKNKSSIW